MTHVTLKLQYLFAICIRNATMDTSRTCSNAFNANPCDVQAFIMSSLTAKQIQTQEMFIWVLTFAVFFGLMFLSFMVTHLKSERIKKAKANLALLDVNPGLTIYKNPDGAKLVQKKKKNASGGAATVVIIFGILILVAYVLATEFDQPGELGFQRKLYKSSNGNIAFKSTAYDMDSKLLDPTNHHKLDLGIIIGNNSALEPKDLYFVSSIDGQCIPMINKCDNSHQDRYVSSSYDFWRTPTLADLTLCGTLPPSRTQNSLSFFMLSPAVGDGGFRASAVVFDEMLTRWETTSKSNEVPRFDISVTAVTAYRLSVFLIGYLFPPERLHKVRVDSIETSEYTTRNVCSNPIAQFTITGTIFSLIDGL